jgi:hypothetical protein
MSPEIIVHILQKMRYPELPGTAQCQESGRRKYLSAQDRLKMQINLMRPNRGHISSFIKRILLLFFPVTPLVRQNREIETFIV